MGNAGCKFCNCQTEKQEDDASEEMKLQMQNNTPIIISQNNLENSNKDNKNNKDKKISTDNQDTNTKKDSKNKQDYHNLSIKINKEINTGQKENTINEISTNNVEPNINNNLNAISEMIKANNNINDNIIEESGKNGNDKKSSNGKENKNHDKNENIKENKEDNDNENNNNDNNMEEKENVICNKEDFIIEENLESLHSEKNNYNENLKEVKNSQLHIKNEKDAKKKINNYKIDKIQFGLEKIDKENLNKEQKKIYNDAINNLKQFYPPKGSEIVHLRKIMSNIIINLKNLINGINYNSDTDDIKYILINGNLNKMINYEINAHKPTMYSERFCILFPKMLKYYKSKVQFLKNLSPLCILPINQISAINIAKTRKSPKKTYHLIICNKFGIKKDFDNNSLLFNLFDSNEINNYLISDDINESLLIFTSDNEKEVYKWYVIIQSLIELSKSEK
jgi:hypothetical protein